MDPSSFLLGALLITGKVLGIGAAGFGIAWWRARKRIRELESQTQAEPRLLQERLDRIESGLDVVSTALDRLTAAHGELQRRLPPPR